MQLPDHRQLLIRPISPLDAEPIAASFSLLTEDEIRRRFLHHLKALSAEHLHQLTHPEPDSDYVVVAAEPLPPGEALVAAVARLSRDTGDRGRAEFGILVTHYVSGQGLGRLLMQRLLEWSRQHRLRELWSDVMNDNTDMLHLAEALGFSREVIANSPGLVRIARTFPARR